MQQLHQTAPPHRIRYADPPGSSSGDRGLTREPFVPNDLTLDEDHHLIILTGPNMGGKSTFLRQSAIITIMAQMGSFVPAAEAKLPIVDRIFTRVGASDDLVPRPFHIHGGDAGDGTHSSPRDAQESHSSR